MPATTATGNAILDTLLRGAAFTAPTATYVAFHTDDPGADGTANEITTGDVPAYARLDAAQGGAMTAGFPAASSKATVNSLDLLLPVNNGAGDVTITHFSIWNDPTAGAARITGALVTPKVWRVGDECIVKAGNLAVGVT